MTHRKITAYSLGRESEYQPNPFEERKLATLLPGGSVYEPDAKSIFATALGWNDPQFLTGIGYTSTDVTPASTPSSLGRYMDFKKADGTVVTMNIEYYYNRVPRVLDTTTVSAKKGLYAVDTHGIDYDTYLWEFVDFFEQEGIDPDKSGFGSLYDAAYELARPVYAPCVIYGNFYNNNQYELDAVPIPTSNSAVYPYRPGVVETVGGTLQAGVYVRIQIPYTSFRIFSIINSQQHATKTFTIDTPATVYRLTDSSATTYLDSMPMQVFSSGKAKRSLGGRSWNCYSFDGNLDLLKFAKGFLELEAKFAKRDRDGGLSVIGLDSTSPATVLPDDTEELWWDEYTVDPVGTVLYGSPYEIGSGGSVYDMTDNGALKLLPGENISQIKAILLSSFAPNVTDIGFIPAELTMRAMPWIEAGDPIEVTTEDNLTVDSFALRIEINGIQYLRMYCESKGGEIIS